MHDDFCDAVWSNKIILELDCLILRKPTGVKIRGEKNSRRNENILVRTRKNIFSLVISYPSRLSYYIMGAKRK